MSTKEVVNQIDELQAHNHIKFIACFIIYVWGGLSLPLFYYITFFLFLSYVLEDNWLKNMLHDEKKLYMPYDEKNSPNSNGMNIDW